MVLEDSPMYVGIDLGTSSVKVILLAKDGHVIATQVKPLTVSRPKPLWSEQNPDDWWQATDKALTALSLKHQLQGVKAIGISGQMHGATIIDADNRVLRSAILWNDGRSFKQCEKLESSVSNYRDITGNLMMPGFTAPKLLWIRENEPELFSQIAKVLLPKDYLRFLMTGVFATDMSDAAGTMWLDVQKRDWSDVLLEATGLTRHQMPKLYEGTQITGFLTSDIASKWSMTTVPVIAGGGDNAAGAIGVGLHKAGQAMLSLGTSGVYFVVSDGFLSNPHQAVHSFCHALPEKWHLMSVMLSAGSCFEWAAKLIGVSTVFEMIKLAESSELPLSPIWFLPYLSGERTPHNDPNAKGVLFGLTHHHGPGHVANAVLEGVGFALADGMDVLHSTGLKPTSIALIGGGSKSEYWRQMLADISGKILEYRIGGDIGPALGAARLALIAMHPSISLEKILLELQLEQVYQPNKQRHAEYELRRIVFRELYERLKPLM